MHGLRSTLAIAILVAFAPAAVAQEQKRPSAKPPQRPQVIIQDRNLHGPPPPPTERNYYGPAPTIQPPMERIQPPAPLAQPPIR